MINYISIEERNRLRRNFYNNIRIFKNYDVPNERMQEIALLADTKKTKSMEKNTGFIKDDYYYQTLKFINLFSFNLGLSSFQERSIFLINVVDKNLDLLLLLKGLTKKEEIAKMAIEILGFYDENLLKLEILYQKKYLPDLDLDKYWGFTVK